MQKTNDQYQSCSESRPCKAHVAVSTLSCWFFVACTAMAFLLYAPFLAIQYDTNGIVEAQGVEGGLLVPHNHILYRPIGRSVYSAARALGYAGNSLWILQILNAVLGAAGIGLAYLIFERVTRHKLAAAGATFWLATSFQYWYVSTDVDYIILAAVFSAASLVFVVRGSGRLSAIPAGIFLALAILTWQASIFLLPGLLLIWSLRANRRGPLLLAGTAAPIAGFAYIALGVFVYDVRGVAGFFAWLFRYGAGQTLPMWGQWRFARAFESLGSGIRSLVPVLLWASPVEILKSGIHVRWGIAVDAAVLCSVALLALPAFTGSFRMSRRHQHAAFLFLAGYASFIPFIAWWDPGQPLWFVIPNIMLAAFLAVAWDALLSRRRMQFIFVGCLVTVAGANFFSTFRPRHNQLGPARQIAQCVSEHMSVADLVITAEWGWPDYLGYLHDRNALNLISNSIPFGKDKQGFLRSVREIVRATQRHGGKVITPDPSQYSTKHLNWLESQTGITQNDLENFEGAPSFVCENRAMKIIAMQPQ